MQGGEGVGVEEGVSQLCPNDTTTGGWGGGATETCCERGGERAGLEDGVSHRCLNDITSERERW